MKTALWLCVSAIAIVSFGQTGCSGDTSTIGTGNTGGNIGGGTGGSAGAGGPTIGAGGSAGAGGPTIGTGGSAGMGGATIGTGGSAGTGGVVAAGGNAGTGGAIVAGGSAGVGGPTIGVGGSAGTGGAIAAGGSAGTDGGSSYKPCAGKACGATCTICDPKDPTCIETAMVKYCSATGTCGAPYPACSTVDAGYKPCAGKVCGDTCTLCAPGDTTCAETMNIIYCTLVGECTSVPSVCPAAVACGASTPCVEPRICMLCPPDNTNCATMACVKNECTWQCP
jgi:hypothetical protein